MTSLCNETHFSKIQEVFNLRKVWHKNIVQFIGACTRPPYLCIITKFMSSGDLVAYIQHYGTFSKAIVRQIMIQLVVGIKFLHENNVIHRDSKPYNSPSNK